ncbi:unnamed protein product [Ambrosiozyma monospora]|uniref:Unnamed protein product n=1 Tax=Ambrosiozyma monospora TaxID=43982 RepID=A0ACB5U3D3_AMBMO|nr:unnamed protein product [Ambrosiozyma monospora]
MVLENKKDEWDSINVNDSSDSEVVKYVDAEESRHPSIKQKKQHQTPPPQQFGHRVSSSHIANAALTLVSSENGSPIPTCSPLQLSEIQMMTSQKFGVSEDVLSENSGREIARLIVKDIIGKFRITNSNHNTPPLVLLLAGNNISGATALVAGRQLFNHGVRAITYLLHDDNSEDELLPCVSTQIKIFEAVGGKTVKSFAQLETLLSKLDSPLEFILDGLQGFDSSLNDLLDPEFTEAANLVNWLYCFHWIAIEFHYEYLQIWIF